ncbi:MAG: ferritin family protein [Spirochaetes bacterium]|nr:ferritin family protein [Spirochaetota bacterium]
MCRTFKSCQAQNIIFFKDKTMSFNFNADEIFRIAEQIEQNGADFYKNASEKVSDSRYKKLLSDLSSMEIDHYNTFKSMHSSLSDKEKEPTVFDPMNESVLYLKALADTQVFYKKQIDISSIEKILVEALSMEKDSIVFYVGIKDLVPERMGKDKIENIINEEKKHIRILAKELSALEK